MHLWFAPVTAPLNYIFRHHVRHAASHLDCTSQLYISVASLICTSQSHLSSALVTCTSHLHLICTSQVQLAFAPHILLIASLIAPLTCTSDLHLYSTSRLHISVALIMYGTQLRISATNLSCTSQSHLLFGPLCFFS